MKVVRAGWTSASFLLYAGALLALVAAAEWLAIISTEHSDGALAGWSALFWGVAELVALALLIQGRRLAAGLAAFVGLGLWAVMVGAFFTWFGWLDNGGDPPLHGFHWGRLGWELLIVLAALIDLRIWRHPLIVAALAPVAWFFVADLVSSGGNWSAAVTLLLGLGFFAIGRGLDSGDRRPYGFWVHVTAGLLIGGAFLYWWHSSDAEWAGIIIVALVFIFVGAGIRRSSYGVLGAAGLAAAAGFYSIPQMFPAPIFDESPPEASPWAGPLAYLCLGVFLALLGMLLYRPRGVESGRA